jgi:hypothetical protein
MAQATAAQPITVGVDTHLDSHVAHAGDQLGRRVGTRSVPTTPTGYQDLLAWAAGIGVLVQVLDQPAPSKRGARARPDEGWLLRWGVGGGT